MGQATSLDELVGLDLGQGYRISFDLTDKLRLILYKDIERGKQGEVLVFNYNPDKVSGLIPVGTSYTQGARVRDKYIPTLSESLDDAMTNLESMLEPFEAIHEGASELVEVTLSEGKELEQTITKIRRDWALKILCAITSMKGEDITFQDYIDEVNQEANKIPHKEPDISAGIRKYHRTGATGLARFSMGAMEVMTLGKSSEYLKDELQEYFYQMLGWELLSSFTEQYSLILEEERDLLRSCGDEDLASRYDHFAESYRMLSAQAEYAAERMNSLVEDYEESLQVLNILEEKPDITEVKGQIIHSVNDSVFGRKE
jgi:hypothetical protein